MMPGVNAGAMGNMEQDEKGMAKTEAIILSMTRTGRNDPDVLNASRRKRIAAGAGVTVQEVNRLMNSFTQMRRMMKQLTGGRKGRKGKKGGRKGGMFGGMKLPF